MQFIDSIKSLFGPAPSISAPKARIAPACEYVIRPLTKRHLREVTLLNAVCFPNGDSYTRHTLDYLLSQPTTLSYRIVTEENETVGFAFVMVNESGTAHLTTIGIAPEHRRRGLAKRLLLHVENALRVRQINTLVLEVRVKNTAAQELYRQKGFYVVQRLNKYYTNGEDCFLMMKAVH
ncbi:MAG: acetyltransferase [Acidobacteria bacterium OLB17]|nr:MAG: acetyltransferase [Acidobacteria bacterium OLB17]MCZ2390548.1 ribosomal protein S18-alanine N-acetyltransferase [Acidobacteriota bacterium]